MLYREIIAVCSEIHTEHINTLYGLNAELLNVKAGGTRSKITYDGIRISDDYKWSRNKTIIQYTRIRKQNKPLAHPYCLETSRIDHPLTASRRQESEVLN